MSLIPRCKWCSHTIWSHTGAIEHTTPMNCGYRGNNCACPQFVLDSRRFKQSVINVRPIRNLEHEVPAP